MAYRFLLSLVLTLTSVAYSFSQHHYVIVGAFAKESNAQKFTGYVKSLRYSASYELNTSKNYFYVYVLRTDDKAEAQSQVRELQQNSEFKDAWLFTGRLKGDKETEIVVAEKPTVQEIKEPEIATVVPDDKPVDSVSLKTDEVTPPVSVVGPEPELKVKGKLFKFIIRTVDGKPLQGEVHNVDLRRGRDIASYKSDAYVDLVHPSSATNPMSIVCGIFGYKEVVKFLDYKNPVEEYGVARDDKGAWVVSFQLERMKKGDVSVMYHVTFYKDAVVMLPVSKTEMDELVNMMKNNPNYEITIHGHCNGNNSRRIIALGENKNYFNNVGSDERNGSAKELSRLRAEAVRQYLEDNGIDKSRSQIYAWGAQNMLVSETSKSARLNDRIEIEIRND